MDLPSVKTGQQSRVTSLLLLLLLRLVSRCETLYPLSPFVFELFVCRGRRCSVYGLLLLLFYLSFYHPSTSYAFAHCLPACLPTCTNACCLTARATACLQWTWTRSRYMAPATGRALGSTRKCR